MNYVRVVCGALASNVPGGGKRYLLGVRKAGLAWGECAEFPGGKVEPGTGESEHEALVREWREELGVDVKVSGRALSVLTFEPPAVGTPFEIALYRISVPGVLVVGERLPAHERTFWATPEEILALERVTPSTYAFAAMLKSLDHLLSVEASIKSLEGLLSPAELWSLRNEALFPSSVMEIGPRHPAWSGVDDDDWDGAAFQVLLAGVKPDMTVVIKPGPDHTWDLIEKMSRAFLSRTTKVSVSQEPAVKPRICSKCGGTMEVPCGCSSPGCTLMTDVNACPKCEPARVTKLLKMHGRRVCARNRWK